MRSVLKYPGSKWNVATKIVELIPDHHSYLEPYFGSGAVLFSKPVSDIETINDLDSDVTNLFRCIQEDSERLARIVMTTPFSREEYDLQFEITEGAVNIDSFQRAAGFLIRCWQGYGYRTNGYKVGWKNDIQGREKAYALWNWYRLPEWIIEITERLRKVQIENRPAMEVIRRFNYPNVFMYLDPPYVIKSRSGKSKQYLHEMTDSDHEELLKEILQSKAEIMISGYESDIYNDYLKDWNKLYLNSCDAHGKTRTEVIWINYEENVQMSLYDLEGVNA
ncbi:MAG: DNA adenine methylase [Lachnospiraceae bacterium]|nr:DNA adenine methylase [Lachnospiraceae bacterium]